MDKWGVMLFIGGEWVDVSDLMEKAAKIDAVRSWWSLFNQCIDSPGAKDRLEEVLWPD